MKVLWFLGLLYPIGGFILSFIIIYKKEDPIIWIPFFLSSPLFFISLWVVLNVFVLHRSCCTCHDSGWLSGIEFSLCGKHSGRISTTDGFGIDSDVPIDRMGLHSNTTTRPTPPPTPDELQPMRQEGS
jgi:hypothetical protein